MKTTVSHLYHDLCGRILDLIAGFWIRRQPAPDLEVCPDCGTPEHIVDAMNAQLLDVYRKECGQ